MKGIAYGVGVGPGDPELMTIKAVNIIKDNDVIALPGKEPKDTAAYRIAVRAVPELAEKELILDAMKQAGEPLNAGKGAELTGLDRKVVDKAFAELKKEGAIVSPVRCKWEPAEK